jgi:short-subunit dehydrogenase
MIKNKNGHVVGVSSTAGKLGFPLRTSYAGSKHAIIGVLDALRAEVNIHNILVTNIMPGYVKTNVSKNAMMAAPGETFGKTDSNIDEGMEAVDFAKQAVLEIYTGNPEVSVADNWIKIRIFVILRAVFPQLVFNFLAKEAAKQLSAVASAKKD